MSGQSIPPISIQLPPEPVGAPSGGAPANGGGFAQDLRSALSTYRRKEDQTAFLRRSGAITSALMAADMAIEDRRLEISRNAAAGYALSALATVPAPTTKPVLVANTTDQPAAAIETASMAMNSNPVSLGPLALQDFPRPAGDNGRGIHWVPTLKSTPEVVDRLVAEAKDMGMKWVVLLNDGTNVGDNDYLVQRLTENGIMPVMRLFTDGLTPLSGDIEGMVRHYRQMGVEYFQLYNEPNLMVETHGRPPNVSDYLDLWIPAAKRVLAAGGLPGIGALSPQGEMDDRQFLTQMLAEVEARGEADLLDRTWLSVHNYTGARPLSDPDGFLRFRQYDAIIQRALGRSLPMVGTEGGTHLGSHLSEEQQVKMVLGAYDHMAKGSDPYNFSYTYWIIANEAGGGRDPEFSQHALIREDGPTALATALMQSA